MSRTATFCVSLVLMLSMLFVLNACSGGAPSLSSTTAAAGVISVVAAENFYGDIAKQLGGSHVAVTSILSDPNIDPHEYESSVQNALAVTHAQLVIQNGDGYDTWMDKLLAASPNPQRTVLVATAIVDQQTARQPALLVWHRQHPEHGQSHHGCTGQAGWRR